PRPPRRRLLYRLRRRTGSAPQKCRSQNAEVRIKTEEESTRAGLHSDFCILTSALDSRCPMVFRALFDKIKAGLVKTRSLFSGIASLFRLRGRVDKDFLGQLEQRLYLADV